MTDILLTPDDLGCEFMTREGKRVECDGTTVRGLFYFNDGCRRYADGRVKGAFPKALDIVSRIEEHVE
jgi:hypothetical protein